MFYGSPVVGPPRRERSGEPMLLGSPVGSPYSPPRGTGGMPGSSPTSAGGVAASGFTPGTPLSSSRPIQQYLLGDHQHSVHSPAGTPRTVRQGGGLSPGRSQNVASTSSQGSQFSPAFKLGVSKLRAGGPPLRPLVDADATNVAAYSPAGLLGVPMPLVGGTPTGHAGTPGRPIYSSTQSSTPSKITSLSGIPLFQETTTASASPPQIDPFYSQGESLTMGDLPLDPCWVTVYGFSAISASYVLQQFERCGEIVLHKMPGDANFMHLKYKEAVQAKQALSKDGRLLTTGLMIGVKPCIDKRVMDENFDITGNSLNVTPAPSLGVSRRRVDMSPFQQVPHKQTGMFARAMDYLLDW